MDKMLNVIPIIPTTDAITNRDAGLTLVGVLLFFVWICCLTKIFDTCNKWIALAFGFAPWIAIGIWLVIR